VFIAALHKGFSNVNWTVQKCIPEDDGGEDILAGRSEWSGITSPFFYGFFF
jgi:hypothetical protein